MEGQPVSAAAGIFRADLEEDINCLTTNATKAHARPFPKRGGGMCFAENDQANKGF